jgi:hypothetical protein
MAAYPTLPTEKSYANSPRDGRVVDIGGDGFARIRKLHPDRDGDFSLEHIVNAAQKTSLENHYAANLTASFSYTSPLPGAAAVNVAYLTRPTYAVFSDDATLQTATVKLTQTS